MDSVKFPSCPFERALKQSITVSISLVNWRGGVDFVIGISFLLDLSITWALRQVPVVLYGWIDQSNDAWKTTVVASNLSERSSQGTIHCFIWGLCWKTKRLLLDNFFYQTSQFPCSSDVVQLSNDHHSWQDLAFFLSLSCCWGTPEMISPCVNCVCSIT